MKNKKLRVLSISVLACLLLLTMIGVSGFAAQKQEDNEAFADVIQANELRFKAVSYTHLDVYKRQVHFSV